MGTERIQLKSLQSFQELLGKDQERCLESFKNEHLESKNLLNKYIKRTSIIAQRFSPEPVDNECFICFDIYPLNFKYSTVLFCLCGVTHHFYYVLYMNIIEDTKIEQLSEFMCELLANLMTVEIPKLKNFTLKFVLCRDNPINKNVFQLFSEDEKTSDLYKTCPFIRETNIVRTAQIQNPYIQRAWLEIMQGTIQQNTLKDIFHRHREVANTKEDPVLKLFVENFYTLAKELLDNRFQVCLRLCTMDRIDQFEQIIRVHLRDYTDRSTNRLFMFDLLRALLHIYSL